MEGDVEFRSKLRRVAMVLLFAAFIMNAIDIINGSNQAISLGFNQIILLMYIIIISAIGLDYIFSTLARMINRQPKKKVRKKRKSILKETGSMAEIPKKEPLDRKIVSVTELVNSLDYSKNSVQKTEDPNLIIKNRFGVLFWSQLVFSLLPLSIISLIYLSSDDLQIQVFYFCFIMTISLIIRYIFIHYIHYSFTRNYQQSFLGKSEISALFTHFELNPVISEYICLMIFFTLANRFLEVIFLLSMVSYLQSSKSSTISKIENNSNVFYDEANDIELFFYPDPSENFYPYFNQEGEKILVTTGMASYLYGTREFATFYESEIETFSWYIPKVVRFTKNYLISPILAILTGYLWLITLNQWEQSVVFIAFIVIALYWGINIVFGWIYCNQSCMTYLNQTLMYV